VGRVIQTLPEGEPIRGVTALDNSLYVFRGNMTSKQIEVYDVDSFRLLNILTVRGLYNAVDIVACGYNRCVYISDGRGSSVRKIALTGTAIARWPVEDTPSCLSLTVNHSVLVTCRKASKIKEFTTDGQLLGHIALSVGSPWHTVQMPSGKLIVCHGHHSTVTHRVCLLDSDGQVVKSYGGQTGPGRNQMHTPAHMAVDENGRVFVVDRNNYRLLLLSPSLTYIRELMSPEQLEWKPYRVSVDVKRRRLYVAINEHIEVGDYTAGRVIVVSI